MKTRYRWVPILLAALCATTARADQVIAENLITQGSLCAGFDCVNNESFGFDTLRLKENNLRIGFHDTSADPDDPANRWQITINDSASGGANHFSVEDLTATRVPFRILAGAPTGSLFVSSAGGLGLGTTNPALNAQILVGDTPGMRFEQDASDGFPAQTWDIAGNEANFFVRDVTAGSHLPFRVRPGARHNSLVIAATGGVGLGTPLPASRFHVYRDDGAARLSVQEASGVNAECRLLELSNHGVVVSRYVIPAGAWSQRVGADAYTLVREASTNPRLALSQSGGLVIAGALAQGSSRALKQDVSPLDVEATLASARELPVFSWRYAAEADAGSHVGPMAEDFHERFAVGADARALAPGDLATAALAAVQAMHRRLQAREERLAMLVARLSELERLVEASARELP